MGILLSTQDKAELVIKHSHDRRKEIEEYITALMKRIEAEETYARNVEEAIKITDRVLQGEERYTSCDEASPRWPSRASNSTA